MSILRFHPTRQYFANISYSSKNLNNVLSYVDSDTYALVHTSGQKTSSYVTSFGLPEIPDGVTLNSVSVLISYENEQGFSDIPCNITYYSNGNKVVSTTYFSCEPATRTLAAYDFNKSQYSFLQRQDSSGNLHVHIPLYGTNNKIYGLEFRLDVTAHYNKVTVNTSGTPETLIDLTADTVTSETLLSGYTAHDRSGAIITGTLNPTPSLQSKSATPTEAAQTIAADSGYDGLSQVTVNPIPTNYGLITYNGSSLMVS